jgi:hypothetical protein
MPNGLTGVHDPSLDVKYADLLKAPGIKEKLKGITTGSVGKVGGGILGWWLAQKILDTVNQMQDIGVQRRGLRSQAGMITPQSLYAQAALPRAQEEESMARQALMTQLTGGVLGPSLAKGEYMIGG